MGQASKPLRVLIVEDDGDDAVLIIRELKRGGYEPDYQVVDTSSQILSALDTSLWDIIITDHNLPGLTSIDILKLIKASSVDTPVIIVSGSIGEDVAVEAMKAGAHDYIMKGNLTRLLPAIERELHEMEIRKAHREAEATIHRMAYHDALTGLANRHQFELHLGQALDSAHLRKQNHALFYLDLDQFKVVNDTCGHMAGDELLRQLALVMKGSLRESDILARLGGDEFAILLENCSLEHAHKVAEHMLKAIRNFRFSWEGRVFPVGSSIGLILINENSKSIADILSKADMACYAAKEGGRNRIHTYADYDREIAQRRNEMQWVSRINSALDENRLLLYKQRVEPLACQTNMQHYEFLLRLQEPNGELVNPGAFIPAAERYNLMASIDCRVVKMALEYQSEQYRNNGADGELGTCFIKLSALSLTDKNTYSEIQKQLKRHKLPPDLLCFGMTETAVISNLAHGLEFIKGIRDKGARFALDDFGTGLGSFSCLKTIPVDYVKIDGGYTQGMQDNVVDYAIVEAINKIAHVVGLETIAPFIENEQTLDMLKSMGIDYAQGYGVEKPTPLGSVPH